MRRWVSLGGWCGPSLMLTKLGIRPPEDVLPFDMVRCTFDGVVELTTNGFSSSLYPSPPIQAGSEANASIYTFSPQSADGFFPAASAAAASTESLEDGAVTPRFTPDPAHAWMLFRGHHACFTHFDLNSPEVQAEFRRRMREWEMMLSPPLKASSSSPIRPVTFVRTAVAENPADELEMLQQFHAAVRRRTQGKMPFRTVFIVHDQADATQPLCAFPEESSGFQSPCVVWNIKRQRGVASSAEPSNDAEPSLLDQCHDGYQTILTTMSKEQKWRSLDASLPAYAAYMKSRGAPFKRYTELSRVAGVPAVRGTCTGFGSTFSAALGRCVHCGSTDGHAVAADRFDTHAPWTEADVDELLMNYALQRCDEVAAVEATALKQKRGANETWRKLKELLSD